MLSQYSSANRNGHEVCSVVDNIMHMFELEPADVQDIVKLATPVAGSREAATSVLTSQVFKDGELREKIVKNTVQNGVGHVEVTENVLDAYGNLLSSQSSAKDYTTPVQPLTPSRPVSVRPGSMQRMPSMLASQRRVAAGRSKKHGKSHKASKRKGSTRSKRNASKRQDKRRR